jgi:hypothetical protein
MVNSIDMSSFNLTLASYYETHCCSCGSRHIRLTTARHRFHGLACVANCDYLLDFIRLSIRDRFLWKIYLYNKNMVKDENKFNYDKDERVLCYHGPFIYEAKVNTRDFKHTSLFLNFFDLDLEKREKGRRIGCESILCTL